MLWWCPGISCCGEPEATVPTLVRFLPINSMDLPRGSAMLGTGPWIRCQSLLLGSSLILFTGEAVADQCKDKEAGFHRWATVPGTSPSTLSLVVGDFVGNDRADVMAITVETAISTLARILALVMTSARDLLLLQQALAILPKGRSFRLAIRRGGLLLHRRQVSRCTGLQSEYRPALPPAHSNKCFPLHESSAHDTHRLPIGSSRDSFVILTSAL